MLNEGRSPTSGSREKLVAAPFQLRKLITGEVLMSEGEPATAMYVVCTGSLRVYRGDPSAIDRVVEIAAVGAGDVIGEVGAILGQLRSATVQALEPTQVLEISADQLPNLAQQHQPLLQVIALALRERTERPYAEIAEMAATIGLILPPSLTTDVQVAGEKTPAMPVPAHDPTSVYPKAVDCPSCGTRFFALSVHPRKDQPAERESDFHVIYRTSFNPSDYELWVCPNDLYAALPADFLNLADTHRLRVARTVEALVADWGDVVPEFNADRTLELRRSALELTLALYRMRELPHVRVAAIAHRLAWCARERGDTEMDKAWLVRALDSYSAAYREADLGGPKEDLRIAYLCGELSLRLADVNGAIGWFARGLRHPALKEHAAWERMLREQWAGARATTPAGRAA
jgi:uncharacterized protein (DUF2225 family)